jgi:hypothetical protein
LKRLSLLLVIFLIASACGGSAPAENSDSDGIAALEDTTDADNDTQASTKTDASGKKKDGADKNVAQRSNSGGNASTGGPKPSGAKTTSKNSAGTPSAAPIPTGRYEYATDGQSSVSGNSRDFPETTTLTADAPRQGEQRQIRDLRDQDGNGTVTETRLLYRPDGVYLTYVKVTSSFPGGFTDVREFDIPEPQLIAPSGAGPGFKQSFSIEGSGTRADFTIKGLKFDEITIGGSAVETLIVDTKIVFSGSLEGEQNSVSWFWAKHVVVLKEEVHTDVTNGPIRVRSDYEAIAEQLPS